MSRCVPGMPCYKGYDVKVYTTYPRGCSTSQPSPFSLPLSSDDVDYTGANLPYTGIQTDDDITTSLQKIDEQLNPEEIFNNLLALLDANPSLLSELCTRVGTCP
jgi:hypothetical protein